MTAPFHRNLVLAAAKLYEQRLEQLPASRIEGHPANLILRTLRAACAAGPALTTQEIAFSTKSVASLTQGEREILLNEFALGLGCDSAEVVAMGTEPASSLDNSESFCLENLGSQIIWLCHGKPAIVAQLTDGFVDSTNTRRFHIYPNDHYRATANHTWGRLACVLGKGNEHEAGAEPGLGDLCYQIDASAYFAGRAKDGRPPTDARLNFLSSTALPTLATTARVLLLHGASMHEEHQGRFARAFLGLPLGIPIGWRRHFSRLGSPLEFFDHDSRRVIAARALGNSVSKDFLARLRDIVSGAGVSPSRGPTVIRRRKS
jgi:hypothetical protein